MGNLAALLPSLSGNSAATPPWVAGNGNPQILGPAAPINQLSNVTITNPTVSGLAASAIPDLSGSYLSRGGGTLSGAFLDSSSASSSFAGALGIGTTSPSDMLAVNGAAYFADITPPSVTTNCLYSNSGSLYWAGSLIGGGGVGNWTSDGTNVWRTGGNVGVGTTSPFTNLSVMGNGYLTGSLAAASLSLTSALPVSSGGTGTSSATGAANNFDYLFASSSNSVARTLASKLSDTVSVKDFGAKGDGATDDTTAIQNAMAYASTTENGAATVYFPSGTYEVSAPIVVNSSVQLDPSATIQATASMAAVVEIGPDSPSRGTNGYLHNAFFEGGTIDANNLANDALFLRHYEHIAVRDVTVNNFLVNGFHFNDPSLGGNNTEVIASDLHTIRTSGNIPVSSASVLMDTNGSDNQLTDSVFTQSDIGIYVKSAGEFFSNIHVYAYPPANGAMSIGFKDEGFQNYWKGCEADGPTVYGMYVSGFDPSIIGCRFDTVTGTNTDDATYAIYFPSSSATAPTASITGSYFDGASGSTRFLSDIAASSTANIQAFGNVDINVASPANVPANVLSLAASATTGTSTIASGQGFTVGGTQFVVQQGSGHAAILGSPTTFQDLLAYGTNGNIGLGATGDTISFTKTGTNFLLANNASGALEFQTGGANARLDITSTSNVGIGTTTPGSIFSVQGVGNWTGATSTYYSTGGINLTSGCFAVAGNCLGLGNFAGTLTINQGGTGTTTWQTNSIPYYNGTNFTENNANFNSTARHSRHRFFLLHRARVLRPSPPVKASPWVERNSSCNRVAVMPPSWARPLHSRTYWRTGQTVISAWAQPATPFHSQRQAPIFY